MSGNPKSADIAVNAPMLAQLGHLFLVFPLGTAAAWSGGVYLALSQAAASASMFLAAGAFVLAGAPFTSGASPSTRWVA